MSVSDLGSVLKKSQQLLKKVGAFIAREGQRFDLDMLEQKADNSLVSFVDKEAERQLVHGLEKLLPESKFLAEEHYSNTSLKEEGYLWVIDPLDGTTNFVHRIPMYCISVALLRDTIPVLGLVYDIPRRDCYWALQKQGAFLNQQRISVSSTTRMEDATLALGFFSEDLEEAKQYMRIFSALSFRTRGWRRLGTAALQMAYVAAGRFDAYLDIHLKPWDMAAGTLLIQEAGGYVGDFLGTSTHLEKGNLLVAGKSYPSFLRFIKQVQFET